MTRMTPKRQCNTAFIIMILVMNVSVFIRGFQHHTFHRPLQQFKGKSIFMIPRTNTQLSFNDLQNVLSDIRTVIATTGTRKGFVRAVQVNSVINKLIRSFITDQKPFQDENGRVSIPRALKLLFEGLGATYIKLGLFLHVIIQ